MKVGIIGSRKRVTSEDQKKLISFFDKVIAESEFWVFGDDDPPKGEDFYGKVQLVSGGYQNGADLWAEQLARIRGLPITVYNAAWSTFGKAAGPIRNKFIAKDADVLIALTHQDSKGTVDTINKFTKYHPNGDVFMI